MAQFSKATFRAAITAVTLAAPLAMAGATAQAQQAGGRPPAAVTVETLHPQSLTLTSTLPGRVRAVAEAEVRPQVNGIITERLFKEGSMVEEGQVLYRIDPTTYEAALAQAEASLTSAQAQLRAAERDFARVQELADRGINSQQAMDDATSARDIAQAQVKMAEAALRTAQIELDHTEIRARLSGLVGLSEVSQGALVTASQATALTTIRKLDTVHVDVTQSAAELLAWRRGAGDIGEGTDAEVALTLADGSQFPHTGLLTAAEPHVDEQTGVVVLRIEFPNDDMLLLPGMYVQVEMPTAPVDNVFLVPQEAVTRDRRGNPQTLVVTAENSVEQRSLTVLQDRGADWVVTEGLSDGDRVIVAGLQSASPGATVAPQERAADGDSASE
ncbi:efflux RND transporter periplasmic adaptor subunit [Pseudooceanicola sp. 200-1SW]|uniref:efflux RND transporter periplasmic adaptor subunit n=1 Tax=Pseudooceanicola sp. 200-1SW TaxID=3425949 RepID=UPI003D7FB810